MAYDEKLAARIRSALEERRDVVEVRMFGGLAFMVRGHMSCGVIGRSLMVRIDAAQEEKLLAETGARPMDFTGRRMPGFLYVDSPGIATTASLARWVDRAATYAETKPRKVKAKAKSPRSRGRGKR
jgi:TfoX/Sxy family transcriptional regulator of competence genes